MQSRLAQAHRQLARQALLPPAPAAATAALAVSSLSHQVKSKSRDCGLDLAQAQRQLVRQAPLPPVSVAATAALAVVGGQGTASTSGAITIAPPNAGDAGMPGVARQALLPPARSRWFVVVQLRHCEVRHTGCNLDWLRRIDSAHKWYRKHERRDHGLVQGVFSRSQRILRSKGGRMI